MAYVSIFFCAKNSEKIPKINKKKCRRFQITLQKARKSK